MKKIYEMIGKVEVFISKWSLAVLSALVFISAITRTMRFPIVWAVDMATFLFGWCVFLSGDVAIRKDKLVSIDLIINRLPKKAQFFLKIFNQVIMIVFLAGLVYYGSILTYTTRFRTFQGMPGLSYSWVTLSVPVGSLMMLITLILKVRNQLKKGYDNTQQSSGKEFL